jgi:hypothetical protein
MRIVGMAEARKMIGPFRHIPIRWRGGSRVGLSFWPAYTFAQ